MSRHVMEVHEWARDYAESLTPSSVTALLRVDVIDAAITVDGVTKGSVHHLTELLAKHSQPGTPYFIVYEEPHGKLPGEDANPNPHYHVFLQCTKTIAALRAAVKRNWTGNAGYSLKNGIPMKIPDHFNYLCKGTGTGQENGPKVIDRSDELTDEVIADMHTLYWKNNDAIQALKSKKRKLISVSEELLHACERSNTGPDKKKIFQKVFDIYSKRIKYLNPTYVRNLVLQTACYLEPTGSARLDLESYCTNNFL